MKEIKNMFKIIGIFLVVLLGLFILQGIMFGAMMFFYALKLIVVASVISFIIYLYYKAKK